jgi:hypothetical protein
MPEGPSLLRLEILNVFCLAESQIVITTLQEISFEQAGNVFSADRAISESLMDRSALKTLLACSKPISWTVVITIWLSARQRIFPTSSRSNDGPSGVAASSILFRSKITARTVDSTVSCVRWI